MVSSFIWFTIDFLNLTVPCGNYNVAVSFLGRRDGRDHLSPAVGSKCQRCLLIEPNVFICKGHVLFFHRQIANCGHFDFSGGNNVTFCVLRDIIGWSLTMFHLCKLSLKGDDCFQNVLECQEDPVFPLHHLSGQRVHMAALTRLPACQDTLFPSLTFLSLLSIPCWDESRMWLVLLLRATICGNLAVLCQIWMLFSRYGTRLLKSRIQVVNRVLSSLSLPRQSRRWQESILRQPLCHFLLFPSIISVSNIPSLRSCSRKRCTRPTIEFKWIWSKSRGNLSIFARLWDGKLIPLVSLLWQACLTKSNSWHEFGSRHRSVSIDSSLKFHFAVHPKTNSHALAPYDYFLN